MHAGNTAPPAIRIWPEVTAELRSPHWAFEAGQGCHPGAPAPAYPLGEGIHLQRRRPGLLAGPRIMAIGPLNRPDLAKRTSETPGACGAAVVLMLAVEAGLSISASRSVQTCITAAKSSALRGLPELQVGCLNGSGNLSACRDFWRLEARGLAGWKLALRHVEVRCLPSPTGSEFVPTDGSRWKAVGHFNPPPSGGSYHTRGT